MIAALRYLRCPHKWLGCGKPCIICPDGISLGRLIVRLYKAVHAVAIMLKLEIGMNIGFSNHEMQSTLAPWLVEVFGEVIVANVEGAKKLGIPAIALP